MSPASLLDNLDRDNGSSICLLMCASTVTQRLPAALAGPARTGADEGFFIIPMRP